MLEKIIRGIATVGLAFGISSCVADTHGLNPGRMSDAFKHDSTQIDSSVLDAGIPSPTLDSGITSDAYTLDSGKELPCAIEDTLLVGESQDYELARNRRYAIELHSLGDNLNGVYTARFYVNNENVTLSIEGNSGDSAFLADQTRITLTGALYQDYAGGVHSATFELNGCKRIPMDAGFSQDSSWNADMGFIDSGNMDSGDPDADPLDAGFSVDASNRDSQPVDLGQPDLGHIFPDASIADQGFADAGFPDSGSADSGITDSDATSTVQACETITPLGRGFLPSINEDIFRRTRNVVFYQEVSHPLYRVMITDIGTGHTSTITQTTINTNSNDFSALAFDDPYVMFEDSLNGQRQFTVINLNNSARPASYSNTYCTDFTGNWAACIDSNQDINIQHIFTGLQDTIPSNSCLGSSDIMNAVYDGYFVLPQGGCQPSSAMYFIPSNSTSSRILLNQISPAQMPIINGPDTLYQVNAPDPVFDGLGDLMLAEHYNGRNPRVSNVTQSLGVQCSTLRIYAALQKNFVPQQSHTIACNGKINNSGTILVANVGNSSVAEVSIPGTQWAAGGITLEGRDLVLSTMHPAFGTGITPELYHCRLTQEMVGE